VEEIIAQKQNAMALFGEYMNGKIKLSEIDVETKKMILQICTERLEIVQRKIQNTEKQIAGLKKFIEE